MSSDDGEIIGFETIHNSGSPKARWNLVVVADGYKKDQLSQFELDAATIRDRLLAEPPFSDLELTKAINMYRLDVASDEAGADHPKCSGVVGDAKAVATFFDSTFCSDKKPRGCFMEMLPWQSKQ